MLKLIKRCAPCAMVITGIFMIWFSAGSSEYSMMAGNGEPGWTFRTAVVGFMLIGAGVLCSRIREAKSKAKK